MVTDKIQLQVEIASLENSDKHLRTDNVRHAAFQNIDLLGMFPDSFVKAAIE